MNFDLTDEQRLLVDTVASFVKKQSPVSRLRGLREDSTGWSREVWQRMGEFGWIAVGLPESAGGLGGSFVDYALILEQLGTALVPEPLLPAIVASSIVARLGTEEQQQRLLAPVIAGEKSIAFAYAEAESRHDPVGPATRAEGNEITGEKRWVLNGHAAETLIVSAKSPKGASVFAVAHDAPGVTIQPVKTMDGHHAAMITFRQAQGELLGEEGGALAALEEALDIGAAAACAEGAGLMRTVLDMTTDYLRTREQFGVKIGSFQALQHRAVDMFIETELCKSMMILAAIRAGDADASERKSAISAAKAQLAVGGKYVTQQAIQLHGGIGVTDEHDIGLYFKRMHILNSLFGDEEFHVTRFADQPGFVGDLG